MTSLLSSDSRVDLIMAAIVEKMNDQELRCPVTGDSEWAIEVSMAALPSVESFRSAPWSEAKPRFFPYAVLVCPTCGYSMFFNLISLGLAEQFGIVVEETE